MYKILGKKQVSPDDERNLLIQEITNSVIAQLKKDFYLLPVANAPAADTVDGRTEKTFFSFGPPQQPVKPPINKAEVDKKNALALAKTYVKSNPELHERMTKLIGENKVEEAMMYSTNFEMCNRPKSSVRKEQSLKEFEKPSIKNNYKAVQSMYKHPTSDAIIMNAVQKDIDGDENLIESTIEEKFQSKDVGKTENLSKNNALNEQIVKHWLETKSSKHSVKTAAVSQASIGMKREAIKQNETPESIKHKHDEWSNRITKFLYQQTSCKKL